MYEKLTCLDLRIVREPGTKPGHKHAYVDKVPELAERLYSNGFAVDEYEAILREHGIEASKLSPDVYGDLRIDEMDARTALSLLTALVKKEEGVEGSFLAACVRSGLIEEIFDRLKTIDWENREIPQWIIEAADKALTALEAFPRNKEITPYRAIATYLEYVGKDGKTRVRALSCKDELDIVDVLHWQAKNHGLYLDSSAYNDMDIGLPINIPFRVCKIEKGSDGPDVLMVFRIDGSQSESVSLSLMRYTDCLEAVYQPIERKIGSQVVVEPTTQQLKTLEECIRSNRIGCWEELHSAPVLDGWSWSLTLNSGDRVIEALGMNACPDGFEALVDCLAETFGFTDFERMLESIGG